MVIRQKVDIIIKTFVDKSIKTDNIKIITENLQKYTLIYILFTEKDQVLNLI